MERSMKECILLVAQYKAAALIAESTEEQATGLMFRHSPLPAMVFPYRYAGIQKFWMKNVKAPLDIVFCLNGKITQICKGEEFSTAMVGDDTLSDLVFEVPYGSCREAGIKIGDSVSLIKPTNRS
jgi:uncharacterized membrane protein (UPF0127 family)